MFDSSTSVPVRGEAAEPPRCAAGVVAAALAPVRAHVGAVAGPAALPVLVGVRGGVDALEALVLASAISAGTSVKVLRGELTRRGASMSKARRLVARAQVVALNPALAEELAAGSLSDEQLDLVAFASNKTDGAAATDAVLLGDVREATVGQGRRIVDDWIRTQQSPDTTETTYGRQRRLRQIRRHTTSDGLSAITAHGDDATIDQIWNRLVGDADAAYRRDGGRDIAVDQHPATAPQRLFDAWADALLGTATTTGAAAPSRPTVVVTATLDPASGELVRPELVGGGPLPPSVFGRLLCNADVVAAAFGRDGEVLWQGRKVRMATAAQVLALIARDRGCVLCGAHFSRCEAHHLIPFSAPARGRTDLDNLALVCRSCHQHVHDEQLTLEHHPAQPANSATIKWRTRPATPAETPPRHKPPNRGQPAKEHEPEHPQPEPEPGQTAA